MLLPRLVVALLAVAVGQAPVATPPPPPDVAEAVKAVSQWFDRLNALDGSAASVDAFVTLHAVDALLTTGPAPHQRGTVVFKGHEGIAKMAADLAATHERLAYRVENEMAREDSAQLYHVTTGPWGGPAVAVQFVAIATVKGEGKRYATPAAAFFQIENGKVRRVRLYLADDERSEVEPDQRRRR